MTTETGPFFVVTGGPGAGKTTLIERLRQRGFETVPETGRAIIRDQMAISGPALPWADRGLFAEMMLSWNMWLYRQAPRGTTPVFFDRGVVDVIGYLKLLGHPVPPHLTEAARQFRYQRTVFIAPPWADIYAHDTERKQSFAEAEATYATHVDAYVEAGYDLVTLPLVPVEERVEFVLATLGERASVTT